jgi:hypothetical protein
MISPYLDLGGLQVESARAETASFPRTAQRARGWFSFAAIFSLL